MEISKEQFLRYEKVRRSGEFNMITDATKVMQITQLSYPEYVYIINNYSQLKSKYMEQNLASQLREALNKGIVDFSYEKKDGTWREARGTRNVGYINEIDGAAPKGTGREVTGSIAYWDLKVEGWRSCREESIIAINKITPIEN